MLISDRKFNNKNKMTNELLMPRYRVIADYPNNKFKVGDILYVHYHKPYHSNNTCTKDKIFDGYTGMWIDLSEVEKHPHLFKSIDWFWGRKESDMPKYLKFVWKGKIDEARKVEKWLYEDEPKNMGQINGFTHESSFEKGLFPRVSLNGWTPATEEEFNYFMNEVLINKNK